MAFEDAPNLFVVGAMKSGTSTLHSYLGGHPAISMSTTKEPNFFIHEAHSEQEWAAYLSLFGDGIYRGESSTQYTKRPRIDGVAANIAEARHDARIIYLMRHPSERTISHYWFAHRKRGERRGLLDVLSDEEEYMSFSNYAFQLAPYFEHFESEQIHTLTTESVERDPQAAIDGILAWLGLSPLPGPLSVARENVTPSRLFTPSRDDRLTKLVSSDGWKRIGRRAVPSFVRDRVLDRFVVDVDRNDRVHAYARKKMQSRHREQTQELSEMLGREFPEWQFEE